MKKLISIFLIISFIMPTTMVYAYTASNVPSCLFDATYYSEMYDDLRQAFGTNKTKLYNHWCNYGKKEGRSPSPVYNPSYYLNNNADLKQAFGNDYSALYNHFCTYGINEFRASSEIYNGMYYKNTYGDLKKAFGNTSKKYLEHFMTYGMKEGRQANDNFNVSVYQANYPDLKKAYGNNLKSYYYHYIKYGISEGRKAAGTTVINKPIVINSTNNSEKTAWVKTNGGNLNLRKYASTNSAILCKIPNNSQVTIYGNSSNGFYKVKYGSRVGYVSSSYITFSKSTNNTSNTSNISSGLVAQNLSKIKLIKQGSKTCKATAVAQSLNIIVGANKYTTSSLGNVPCKNIGGSTYKGSDGNTYVATYKQDSYVGSRAEQQAQIDKALSAGLPIVVTVHKIPVGTPTTHHWVTIIGKNGSTYDIIDPATGTKRTMTSAKYDFGLADYSDGMHYGYVSFKR